LNDPKSSNANCGDKTIDAGTPLANNYGRTVVSVATSVKPSFLLGFSFQSVVSIQHQFRVFISITFTNYMST